MKKLISIIKKNLTVLLRSKSSALIVIIGPLLVIFLVGLAFDNSNIFSVNIGVYSDNYNNLTLSFVDKLSERQFAITEMKSEKACVDSIKDGINHLCIVFPPNLTVEQSNLSNEIVFHVDYSRISLVWAVRDIITEKLESRSKELSIDLTDVILEKLRTAQDEIRSQKPVVVGFTNDYIAIQQGVDDIKGDLDGLDLYVSYDDFHLNDVKTKGDELVTLSKLVIDRSNSALGSVATDVSGLGNVSGSEQMNQKISESRVWLANVEKTLTETNENMTLLLTGMESTVDEAK